jgi:hypothetical protein
MTMSARRLARILLALVPSMFMIGCSKAIDDLPRQPVAGTVTMDGQPLPDGVILFSPDGKASENSTGETATIKDGAFSLPRENGLVPGSYRVSISHAPMETVKTKAKGALANPTRLGKEMIHERYNKKTELKAEIKAGGTKNLDFPLKSK